MSPLTLQAPPAWRTIRDHNGKILCRIDVNRLLLEFKRRGDITIVDLVDFVATDDSSRPGERHNGEKPT